MIPLLALALIVQDPAPSPAPQVCAETPATEFSLLDGTPARLKLGRDLSSADAKAGDLVDFKVAEDVRVKDIELPKGTEATAYVCGNANLDPAKFAKANRVLAGRAVFSRGAAQEVK